MKILIAEDEPLMLKTLALRLRKDGHEVITAADGRQATDYFLNADMDMVITDIMMPFASGLELLEIVRRRKDKKIPVIVLSAMGQENVVIEAFKLGADDYITKPFSPVELSMRVRRFTSAA